MTLAEAREAALANCKVPPPRHDPRTELALLNEAARATSHCETSAEVGTVVTQQAL